MAVFALMTPCWLVATLATQGARPGGRGCEFVGCFPAGTHLSGQ